MTKATFIGDPRDGSGPDTITVRGVTFEKGKAKTVPDEVATKLATNSHFKVSGQKGADADEAPEHVEGATVASTTGDPETASRQTLEALEDVNTGDASEPMSQPRPGKARAKA